MNEKKAIEHLRALLRTAKKYGYPTERMLVCDGFLTALNMMSGKKYGFSGTDIFIRDSYGYVKEYIEEVA